MDEDHRRLESAMKAFYKEHINDAMATYLQHFGEQRGPEFREKPFLLMSLDFITRHFESRGEFDELFDVYKMILAGIKDPDVYMRLGALLLRNNYPQEAICQYHKALELSPDSVCATAGLHDAYYAIVDRWHFPMLNDRDRNKKYRNAITKAVQFMKSCGDGPRVLDIGSGTGILSMVAADAGASIVYACEMSDPMSDLSKVILQDHSKMEKITVLNQHSSSIKIPESIDARVDLVVTETFDAGLLGEHILTNLKYAHENLLTNSGKVLPQSATVWCSFVDCKWLRRQQRMVKKNGSHLTCLDDLKVCMIAEPLKEPYTSEDIARLRGGFTELCKPFKLLNIDFNDAKLIDQLIAGKEFSWKVPCTTSGIVDAAIMWFDLHIDGDNCISTAPTKESCWEQAVFPVIHAQTNKRNLLKVSTESFVQGYFRCKEHFTLESIEIVNSPTSPEKLDQIRETYPERNRYQIIMLDYETMEFLNSSKWVDEVDATLIKVCNDACIIDVSLFPICGLLGLKNGGKELAVIESKNDDNLRTIATLNGVNLDRISFYSHVMDLCFMDHTVWDILIFDPVDRSGTLRPGILEDVALLKSFSLKPEGVFIPDKVLTMAHAIKSDLLVSQSRIVSTEHTLNYDIGQHLNEYRSRVQYNVDLRTLDHTKMSLPICLNIINFTESVTFDNFIPSFEPTEQEKEFSSIMDGEISAIVVWFVMKMRSTGDIDDIDDVFDHEHDNGCSYTYSFYESRRDFISTLDCRSHWNQIAFVHKNEIVVKKHDVIATSAEIEKSIVHLETPEI